MSLMDEKLNNGNKITSLRASIQAVKNMMKVPKCASDPVVNRRLVHYEGQLMEYAISCLSDPIIRLEMIDDLKYQIRVIDQMNETLNLQDETHADLMHFTKQLAQLQLLEPINPPLPYSKGNLTNSQTRWGQIKVETMTYSTAPPGGMDISDEKHNILSEDNKLENLLKYMKKLKDEILNNKFHGEELVEKKELYKHLFDQSRILLDEDLSQIEKY